MKVSITRNNKSYTIETLVRLKNANGGLDIYDTSSILGSRFVEDSEIRDGKQIVSITDKEPMFGSSLLSEDGSKLRVVIDRSMGIINPYITINDWSIRETAQNGEGKFKISSVKYPYDIADLPDFVPIEGLPNAQQQSTSQTSNSAANNTNTQSSQEGAGLGTVIAAGLVGVALHAIKDKKEDDSDDEEESFERQANSYTKPSSSGRSIGSMRRSLMEALTIK